MHTAVNTPQRDMSRQPVPKLLFGSSASQRWACCAAGKHSRPRGGERERERRARKVAAAAAAAAASPEGAGGLEAAGGLQLHVPPFLTCSRVCNLGYQGKFMTNTA